MVPTANAEDFSNTLGSNDKEGETVKEARAIGWSSDVGAKDVASKDADVILAGRCGAGDQQACQELVDAHLRMVYALGYQLLGSHDEALDLSQEVFLRVFRTIGRFQGRASLRTWIYRIVVNSARNRHRWFQRHRMAYLVSLDAHVVDHGEPVAPSSSSPASALDRKQTEERVRRALARLPLDQRTTLVLRELHGMRYAEIAFSLNVTVSAVKSRLSRAREALRRTLRSS